MTEIMTENYLTVEEVAETLRITRRAVQAMCRNGRIGSTNAGKRYLIPQESLDEYLKIRRGSVNLTGLVINKNLRR